MGVLAEDRRNTPWWTGKGSRWAAVGELGGRGRAGAVTVGLVEG